MRYIGLAVIFGSVGVILSGLLFGGLATFGNEFNADRWCFVAAFLPLLGILPVAGRFAANAGCGPNGNRAATVVVRLTLAAFGVIFPVLSTHVALCVAACVWHTASFGPPPVGFFEQLLDPGSVAPLMEQRGAGSPEPVNFLVRSAIGGVLGLVCVVAVIRYRLGLWEVLFDRRVVGYFAAGHPRRGARRTDGAPQRMNALRARLAWGTPTASALPESELCFLCGKPLMAGEMASRVCRACKM